jgi:cytochrome c-type biogenesis protein CcmE
VSRRWKLALGAAVVLLALGGLVLTGVQQSVVYFVTPTELRAAEGRTAGRAYRLGGMVVPGSLKRDPATLRQEFSISDGQAAVPVVFRGVPPDLFAEGRGAVVEGTLGGDGTFVATTIMAKHSEEYRAPHDAQPGYQELLKTLRDDGSPAAGPAAGPAARP